VAVSTLVYLISDDATVGTKIREILHREGEDVPASQMIPLASAAGTLSGKSADLVVVVLPSAAEGAVAALALLEGRVGARVLVVGPASDPKMVLRALRGGVDDYLDESELEEELKAALARWRLTRKGPDESGRVIALLAPSGGSGSSTLSVNVATALAKQHGSAALIDLKLHSGDLAALLDLKPTYTLADLCLNVSRIDRTLFDRTLARHQSGVHLLASPRTLADVLHVTPEGVRQALSQAQAEFPYVVIDVDHSFGPEQTAALQEAQVVLIVLRLDFTSLRNSRRALEHLEQIGVPRDRVRLVANRYGQPKEVPVSKAEEALGLKIAHFVPDDAKTVNRANNNGVPLILDAPSARVSKSVVNLAASVNGRHKTH
jgi:pilus assembly protein CpaE